MKDWALGKKHVFLTEGTRQHLERLRTEKRNASVTLIQSGLDFSLELYGSLLASFEHARPGLNKQNEISVWRGFSARKKWPAVRRGLQSHGGNLHQRTSKPSRPRPQV